MKIAENIVDLTGNTPLVWLKNISKGLPAKIAAKLEFYNPTSSVKDRTAKALIEDGEKKGLIEKDTTIIEPTSGNTGIALACICAAKGYRLILTMPETMSIERRKLLKSLGAELVLTPKDLGMTGAIEKAYEIKQSIKNSIILHQFTNKANPQYHYETTAREIWNDTEGEANILVAGVGTGGTISGVAKFFKERKSSFKVIAVEPYESPVLSGGQASIHQIQGIGAGFVPETLSVDLIDEIVRVKSIDAIKTMKKVIETEGILCGISSGAAIYAALEIALKPENENNLIVVILPDTAERYLSMDIFEE